MALIFSGASCARLAFQPTARRRFCSICRRCSDGVFSPNVLVQSAVRSLQTQTCSARSISLGSSCRARWSFRNLVTMALQFVMFIGFFAYHAWFTPYTGAPAGWRLLLLPLLVVQTAMFAFGGWALDRILHGAIPRPSARPAVFNSWMDVSYPGFHPRLSIHRQTYVVLYLNPMAPIVEGFQRSCSGSAPVQLPMVAISIVETGIVLIVGIVLFQRVARTAVDTV